MSGKTVIIMAGGTGGHIFPGLAVADELRARSIPVLWMGAGGMEQRLVGSAGIAIESIKISGLRGKGLVSWLKAPFKMLVALWQAYRIIRRSRPQAVLSMGGFVAGPGGLMAWLMRKPLFIHEQNSIAGLTNRVLSRFARKVMTGFPGALGEDGLHVGNPVRQTIADLDAPVQRFENRSDVLRVLVLGGSQGAKRLNDVMPQALVLLNEDQRPVIRHQCGQRHLDSGRAAYAEVAVDVTLSAFIEDMSEAYGWADLVVCRSGALTLAELTAAGVGSVLVPYPYAVDDHQTTNARFLSDAGAALLIDESDLSAEGLAEILRNMNRARLLEMAEIARGLAKTDSAKQVVDAMEVVA